MHAEILSDTFAPYFHSFNCELVTTFTQQLQGAFYFDNKLALRNYSIVKIALRNILSSLAVFFPCRSIYDKIDKDRNGQVTEQELSDWIKYVQTRYIRIDTDRQWLEHNPDNNATISWTAYKHRVYGIDQRGRLLIYCISVPCNSN